MIKYDGNLTAHPEKKQLRVNLHYRSVNPKKGERKFIYEKRVYFLKLIVNKTK